MTNSPERRQYQRQFLLAGLGYLLVLPFSIWLLKTIDFGALEFAVVLSPVVPIIWGVRVSLRLLELMDELQQRIQLIALGFAAIVTGLVTFAYGFLEGIGWPRVELIWVLPLMIILWGVGKKFAERRYK